MPPLGKRGHTPLCPLFRLSYGGVVITEAGNDPKVKALAYIAAFAPDAGESVSSLIANPPPGAPVPPILPPQDGFLFLDRDRFADSFAADVTPGQAAFMADSQVPWGVEALTGAVTEPAWTTKPSWYLVAADDRMEKGDTHLCVPFQPLSIMLRMVPLPGPGRMLSTDAFPPTSPGHGRARPCL